MSRRGRRRWRGVVYARRTWKTSRTNRQDWDASEDWQTRRVGTTERIGRSADRANAADRMDRADERIAQIELQRCWADRWFGADERVGEDWAEPTKRSASREGLGGSLS